MEPETVQNSAYKSYKNQKTFMLPDRLQATSRTPKRKIFPSNFKILPKKTLLLSQSLDYEYGPGQPDLVKLRDKIGLVPIGKELARERKSVILGKNKELLFMIENFMGSRTGNGCQQMELERRVGGNREECKDGYEKTVEYCCGDGYKEYQNDLEKKMKIERFRLGNYRNRRRRSMIL